MVQSLKVILWGEEIGRLAWDTRRRLSCFMYNPAFLKKGLNISPLAAPVDGARGLNLYGEKRLRFIKKIQMNFIYRQT
jgi:serine/threonine-protein kinase HipA